MAFGLICLIYIIGLAIIFAELFVPGSFLGFIGAAVMITSMALAFYHHPPLYGLCLVFITLIVVPTMLIWWLHRVSLDSSQNIEEGYTSADESLEALKDKEGVSLTILRPSGMAKIDGRRVDVTTETIVVEANTPIQVVKIEGNRVVVRPIELPQKEEI